LLPTGDSEYGDDSAATGLAEFNRYYNRQQNTAAKWSSKMTSEETSETAVDQHLVTKKLSRVYINSPTGPQL